MNVDNRPQPAPNVNAASTTPQKKTRRPLWRGCLTLAVTLAILIGAVFGVLWLLRGNHAKPLYVQAYTFARTIMQTQSDNADHTVYLIGDPIDKVIAFYTAAFGKAESINDNGCFLAKSPAIKAGEQPVQIAQCITDNSFLDITQFVSVSIKPSPDTPGQVLVTIDRTW